MRLKNVNVSIMTAGRVHYVTYQDVLACINWIAVAEVIVTAVFHCVHAMLVGVVSDVRMQTVPVNLTATLTTAQHVLVMVQLQHLCVDVLANGLEKVVRRNVYMV